MSRRVGVRDVARRANVSLGTVSNVLNGLDTVAPDYVQRVRNAIDELGFVPNQNARQLKGGASTTIALMTMTSYSPFFSSLADAAETIAERHGSSVVIASSAQSAQREQRYLSLFEQQRVQGVILAPVHGVSLQIAGAHERGLPIVLLETHGYAGRFCSVALDSEAGGYLAAQHLIDQGRRRIVMVGGPRDQVGDRERGAARALSEAGRELEVIETADLSIEEGRSVARALLSRDRLPDGVFAANDLIGLGLLAELVHSGGVRVPEDVAVIGYDDIPFAESALVALTSIRQPVVPLAGAAIELLLAEASDGTEHEHEQRLFAPDLVVRQSTVGVVTR